MKHATLTTLSTHEFTTPAGTLFTAVDGTGAVVRLQFTRDCTGRELEAELAAGGREVRRNKSRCRTVERQVKEYFRGRRWEFELDLAPEGTEFQHAVWDAVAEIPFGATATYRELARRVGRPTAVRAVGRCNALNPIVIVVPCHRVIGSDGSLTGYGGGIENKELLLELEGQ